MKKVPDFDIELSQATDYIMESPLAVKAFAQPPFMQYTNILRRLIQSIDRLADNCHMPEFTNHALPHICSIVRRASEWAEEDGWIKELSGKEAGYLLLALIIHDIGMLSQDAGDLPEKDKSNNMKGFADISNWVRRTHVIRLEGLVLRLMQEELKKDESLRVHLLAVIGMAASHQSWEWEEAFVSQTEAIRELGLSIDKIAALNAVIAVCDLLDEDSNRCDTITLIKYRHGSMENMAHWIRHALTVEVDGVRRHTVKVTFRKLLPSEQRHEKIYRALRNHYRLVKLYNNRLEKINAQIEHLVFDPADGLPAMEDPISDELKGIWTKLPEFKDNIVEQILSTFMREALNQDGGDAEMRRRLNDIGLEAIDLTLENDFLEPTTIFFPEEKLLFDEKNFREKLTYIKMQADSAYLDGNIGKLRHLCYVAWERWEDEISLNETYWIFIYLTIFQKYGDEIAELSYRYDNSLKSGMQKRDAEKKLICEGDYQRLLDVWLMMQEPLVSVEWYEKYKKHISEGIYQNLNHDIATELLLENLVGMIWYYEQDGSAWKDVAKCLCDKVDCVMREKLSAYVNELKLMHTIINHTDREASQKIKHGRRHPLAKAWVDFWNDDWKKQETDIPEICRIGNRNRDYMEPVQGYLNLVRWNIMWQRRNEEKPETSDDYFIGVDISSNAEINRTLKSDNESEKRREDQQEQVDKIWEKEMSIGRHRYGRIIIEQPLPSFWEQRSLMVESLLGSCRRKENDSATQRLQIIRLLAQQTLDAIRYWNLGEYIDAIRHRTELNYLSGVYTDAYGEYCGDIHALSTSITDYIRSLSDKVLTGEERKMAARLLTKYAPGQLDAIVDYIVKQSIPLQWKGAINVIESFAQYFNILQRKKLLDWLIRYHKYYQEQKRYFSLSQYQFLRFWAKDMDADDWKKIKFLIDEIFTNQGILMSNSELAEAVFDYAPWEWNLNYLKAMRQYPENHRKSADIYRAVIVMSKRSDANLKILHEFVSDALDDLNRRPEIISREENFGEEGTEAADLTDDDISSEVLTAIRERYVELDKLIDVTNLHELESVDLERIEKSLSKLEEKLRQRGDLNGYDSTIMNPVVEAFSNKNWKTEDITREKEIVNRVFQIMEKYRENMSVLFFCDFCILFRRMESSCSSSLKAYINQIVLEHMVRQSFICPAKQSLEDGPYHMFRFDNGSRNQYEINVALLLVTGMQELSGEQRPEAVRYMTRALETDAPVIYNYAMAMFSCFFLTGDANEATTILAWGGLQFILGRLVTSENQTNQTKADEIRPWIQKAVAAMEESKNWFGHKGFRFYVHQNEEYKEWFDKIGCTFEEKTGQSSPSP